MTGFFLCMNLSYMVNLKVRYPLLLFIMLVLGSCSRPDYGALLHFNNAELYFTERVTESEATRLGEYLVDYGIFSGQVITVQLDKDQTTYLFRWVFPDTTTLDSTALRNVGLFTIQLSEEVFHHAPVDIHFCNERLETQKVVPFLATNTEAVRQDQE